MPVTTPFSGIVMQEFDQRSNRLVGPIKLIFEGTNLGVTEGPQLYRRGDYYYLVVAEGGTGPRHAVTLARSRTIDGPYEVDPTNPILTTAHAPEYPRMVEMAAIGLALALVPDKVWEPLALQARDQRARDARQQLAVFSRAGEPGSGKRGHRA